MIRSLFFCFALCTTYLIHAEPIKVPTELYKGESDKDSPGLYPLIGHLTFRKMCDLRIDQHTEWFDPEMVRQGDTIYLNLWYLGWFANEVHDKIKVPYILVCGDVGAWQPDPAVKKLLFDPKLAAWFCRNIIFSNHPKVFQLPTGQDLDLFIGEKARVELLRAISRKAIFSKDHLLYMSHFPRPYGDRDKIVKLFEDKPYCFSRNTKTADRESSDNYNGWGGTSRPQFYEDISASKFVLSPIGLEMDSIRTWEALVLDAIPIVEHTFLDPIYEGLPVVKVHNWEEIDEQFLAQKYEELQGMSLEKAHFDYWRDLIQGVQKRVKNGDLSFARLEATQFSPLDQYDLRMVLNEYGKGEPLSLIYKGSLTGVRPLQLAYFLEFVSTVYVYDQWMDQEQFVSLWNHLNEKHLWINRGKVTIFKEDEFNKIFSMGKPYPIFLDLTHFRSSVYIDFATFRHSLQKDLKDIYVRSYPGSLICGNMAGDEYVSEVLERFSKDTGVTIQRKGSIWFFNR
ncbi:MAG: hypothetical protein HYX48_06370 [Chlamydiales bacterium]|nr:hypothetical protein [Chlamydiales bacterium]